jgi:hypothetical protein
LKTCVLRKRALDVGVDCDEDECVFWAQLGIDGTPQCAIEYFKLLDAPGQELADWLLQLKERDEIVAALGIERIGRNGERVTR